MMIGCALPILLLLFVGRSGSGSWFKWAMLGVVGLMVVFHLFGMWHGKNEDFDQQNQPEPKPTEDNEHKH